MTASGTPAASALVVIMPQYDFPCPALHRIGAVPELAPGVLKTWTAADGQFAFRGIPQAFRDCCIYSRGTDGSTSLQQYHFQGYPHWEAFIHLSHGRIEGRLLDADGETPLPGIAVRWTNRSPGSGPAHGPFEVISGQDGEFLLPGCRRGQYELEAVRYQAPPPDDRGMRQPWARVIGATRLVLGRNEVAAVSFQATPQAVSGTVTWTTGAPAEGAAVKLGWPSRAWCRSDAHGSFRLDNVMPGDYRLEITSEARAARRVYRQVVPPEGEPATVHATLFSPVALLHVEDAAGQPVRDAAGRVGIAWPGAALQTDGHGDAALSLADFTSPCVAVVYFAGSGYGILRWDNFDDLLAAAPARLRLSPGSTVHGRIVDSSGEPLGEALVQPFARGPGDFAGAFRELFLARPKSGRTAARPPSSQTCHGDGEFTLEQLPPGIFELHISLLYHQAAVATVEIEQDGTSVEMGDIVVPRNDRWGPLQGRAVHDGQPLVNANGTETVRRPVPAGRRHAPEREDRHAFRTDAAGWFTLWPLWQGQYELTTSPQDTTTWQPVTVPGPEVTLQVPD